MEIPKSVSRQLGTSIKTLQIAIENANDQAWEYGDPPFFQIVFHVINSLDMYFSTFDPKFKELPDDYQLPIHLQKYSEIGFFDNDPAITKAPENIIKKEVLLEFLELTKTNIRRYFSENIELQFNDNSGFPWLKIDKFELILHNIRHIMAHTGVLNEYLKQNNCNITGWVPRTEL